MLSHKKDQRDPEPDQEAPLEQGVDGVEHARRAEQAPHQAVGVQRRAVVGAGEAARLVRRAEALDVVEDEVLRRDRHEAGDDDGADLRAEHGARRDLDVVRQLLVLHVVVAVAGERPRAQRLPEEEGVGVVGEQAGLSMSAGWLCHLDGK